LMKSLSGFTMGGIFFLFVLFWSGLYLPGNIGA